MTNRTVRLSAEMIARLRAYQLELIMREKKKISLIQASRRFADTAITNTDKIGDGVKRIRKRWKF